MMMFEQFHFLRPYWLILLPLLIVVLWMMLKRKLGNRSWEAICDQDLLPHILIGGSARSRGLPVFLLALGGSIAILSLAGPVWEKLPQPVFNNESALVIALDLSHSMDSNDVSPSRLTRARFKIADILSQNENGQVALLVYAADAFTVTPLTDDMPTIISQLPALTTRIMPAQGNRTDRALAKAEELLKGAGQSEGNILLVTDEVDLISISTQVSELAQQGYNISVLGIGTAHGAPVVLEDGSFLKDHKGEIVIPVLNDKPLRELAQLGGGRYRGMTPDDSDIQSLLAGTSLPSRSTKSEQSEFEMDTWREQGPWLLLLLLPLGALAFRRGYILCFFCFLLPLPENAHAFDWESLWLRDDQRAHRALENNDPARASELFSDPAWKGAAQYKAGNFEDSAESLQSSEDLENIYNKGNALARLGQYEEAIVAYDKVLEHLPEHEDAIFNKQLLEQELENQEQQKQQNQDQQQEQDENQENQENQESDNQQQQDNQESDNQQQQDQQEQNDKQGQDENTEQNDEMSEEQQQQEQEQKEKEKEQQQQADKEAEENKSEEEQQQLAESSSEESDEEQQATEQWLRRIPDDPAGLLRRKFRYQYQQGANQQAAEEKKW